MNTSNMVAWLRVGTLAAAAMSVLCACSTIVSGRKAGAGADGIHYWLPQPVLVVTPQTDGTLKVEPDSVTDERSEYVLSATSFIGSYTFEVKVEKGLLTSVNMDSDNTAVPKAIVEAQRDIELAKRDAEKAKADKEAAALTARNDKIDAAKAAVRQAEYALAAARAERDRLVASGADKPTRDSAEQAVTRATSTLDAARRELAYLAGLSPPASNNADAGALGNADGEGAIAARSQTAAGPVIYRIQQWRDADGPNVRIVEAQWEMNAPEGRPKDAASGQVKFDTVSSTAARAVAPCGGFEFKGAPVVKAGALKMVLTVDRPIAAIEPPDGENAKVRTPDGAEVGKAILVLAKDGQRIDVTLPKGLKPTEYALGFVYRPSDREDGTLSAECKFRVKK